MSSIDWARDLSADDVVAGLLDLSACTGFSLDAFMSVSTVEWNDDILTACVECNERPRLLLNRAFVARHCQTPERLALLLLHELSHISLGHTRLYPRPTPVHNIAFDAVINARLLLLLLERGIRPEPYAELLCDLYGAAEDPFFVLRPPPGWPDAAQWDASGCCRPALRRIHRALYDTERAADDVTYGELVDALRSRGHGSVPGGKDAEGRLLGGHGVTEAEWATVRGTRDANAAEMLGDTLRTLPGELGRGWAARQHTQVLAIERDRASRALQRALEALLRRVFVAQSASSRRWQECSVPIVSVNPMHDRRATARYALARHFGAPAPRLFADRIVHRSPDRTAASVYLDVSGSMTELIGPLHAALASLHRLLAPHVLAFSSDVEPVRMVDFKAGALRTTFGTDIAPVLQHALTQRAGRTPRRALVLTDGYFAAPDRQLVARLRHEHVELHVGVIGNGPLPDWNWAASATRLPHLNIAQGR
jgi:hypothetical protein